MSLFTRQQFMQTTRNIMAAVQKGLPMLSRAELLGQINDEL